MSLSRFQLVLWTLIILSAFLTIALSRIAANATVNPLNIAMQPELWALLGISTASLVGTPLLNGEKRQKEPDKKENKFPTDSNMENVGIVAVNKDSKYAAFSDMFKGDELTTANNINMAKVQMFFFTIIVALSYAALLYVLISWPKILMAPSVTFPLLTPAIIAILGISHAGYLVNKATDQTAIK